MKYQIQFFSTSWAELTISDLDRIPDKTKIRVVTKTQELRAIGIPEAKR